MGDVGSTRYELALLPPCPTIRVLSYLKLSYFDLNALIKKLSAPKGLGFSSFFYNTNLIDVLQRINMSNPNK